MGQKEMLMMYSIPVFLKDGCYFILGKRLGKRFRVGHIAVVNETSIFTCLLMIRRKQQVHLVLVTQIRTIECS